MGKKGTHMYSHAGATIESKEPGVFTDTSAGWMASMGMSLARFQFHWGTSQPTQGGPIDWSIPDAQIAIAESHGLLVDWPLQQTPSWALQSGAQQVPQAQFMADYAIQVVQRYGSRIHRFEVGNEEWSFEQNIALRSASNYYNVFSAVQQALANAGFTGHIGSFGFTNYHDTTSITDWFTQFLGYGPKVSDIGLHFYHDGQEPNTTIPGHPGLQSVISAIRVATQLPINLSEFGYRTHCDAQHPSPCNEITPDLQAQYTTTIFETMYSDNPKNKVMIYTVQPGTQVMSIYQNDVPLPAVAAIQSFIGSH